MEHAVFVKCIIKLPITIMFFFAIFLYLVFVHCLKFIFLVRNVHHVNPKVDGSVHNVISLVGFAVRCPRGLGNFFIM